MIVNNEGHIEYSVKTENDPEVTSIVTNSKENSSVKSF